MSNSFDPDQAQRIVKPDLGQNCLPWLSADDTGRQRVKLHINTEISKTNGTFMFKSHKPVTHPVDNCSKLLAIDHFRAG